jgi:hypothetical protein
MAGVERGGDCGFAGGWGDLTPPVENIDLSRNADRPSRHRRPIRRPEGLSEHWRRLRLAKAGRLAIHDFFGGHAPID